MTVSTLRPNGTTSNTGAVTGAANAHTALSDDGDSSYVTFDEGEGATLPLEDFSLPAGAVVKSINVRARCAKVAGQAPISRAQVLGQELADLGVSYDRVLPVTWVNLATISYGSLEDAALLDSEVDAAIDAASVAISNIIGGGSQLKVYELYVDVTYVEKPVVNVTAPTGTITDTNVPTVEWEWS